MSAEEVTGLVVAAVWVLPVTVGAIRRCMAVVLASAVAAAVIGAAAWGPAGAAVAAGWAASLVVLVVLRPRRWRTDAEARRRLLWWAAGATAAFASTGASVTLALVTGVPDHVGAWCTGALAPLPVAVTMALLPGALGTAERAVTEAVVATPLTALAVAAYLGFVVLGRARLPENKEHELVAATILATIAVAVLGPYMRSRWLDSARSWIQADRGSSEVVHALQTQMSRRVPLDELLLQLAESLRGSIAPAGAEIWVHTDGALTRTVSVPRRPASSVAVNAREREVLASTRIAGTGWLGFWLPALLAATEGKVAVGTTPALDSLDDPEALIRVAPASHAGELYGLVVVRRGAGDRQFTTESDRTLIEIARQVGVILYNAKLDAALQASLDELSRQNAELEASRLRIVTAADDARRKLERDLHDGAQQHLVALAVKISMTQQLLGDHPAAPMMTELRDDVQTSVTALRELAHGIYPPLLRNHGLGKALQSVTRRSALPTTVDVDLNERFSEPIEAAVYFCCLEAIQNAGKYAGDGASATVQVTREGDVLRFTVSDDGAGFALGPEGATGIGFVNMADRLGAVGGTLAVTSTPGAGTTVTGTIPIDPLV